MGVLTVYECNLGGERFDTDRPEDVIVFDIREPKNGQPLVHTDRTVAVCRECLEDAGISGQKFPSGLNFVGADEGRVIGYNFRSASEAINGSRVLSDKWVARDEAHFPSRYEDFVAFVEEAFL